MKNVNENIKDFFEGRIKRNIDLPYPSNIDLFFWGGNKDINLYLHYIISHSALFVHCKDNSFVYKKIIIIYQNLEVNKDYFNDFFKKLEGKVELKFLIMKTLETTELEKVLNANQQAFIIIFEIEKYTTSNQDPRLDKVLENYQISNFEIPYINVVNNTLYLENKVGSNFVLLDSQLYLSEFDFFKPLDDIEKLSFCGIIHSLNEIQIEIKNTLQEFINQKNLYDAIQYIDGLSNSYNKDFIKLQLYSDFSKQNDLGLYKHEIERLFESLDTQDLSINEYLKMSEISKLNFNKETTMSFLNKAMELAQDYTHYERIYELSENLSEDLKRKVYSMLLCKYPNSSKVKLHKINQLIVQENYEEALHFAINNGFKLDLINYLKFLNENLNKINTNPSYDIFILAIQKGIANSYLSSLLKTIIKYYKNDNKILDWITILMNSTNIFDKNFIYNEYYLFADYILKNISKIDEDVFSCLSLTLEYLFDLKNISNQSLIDVKNNLVKLIDYSENNGYGYGYILQFIFAKFMKDDYKLLGSQDVTEIKILTSPDMIMDWVERIKDDLFSKNIIEINGEYHSFSLTLPNIQLIDEILLINTQNFLNYLNNHNDTKQDLLSFYNEILYLVYNLAPFSSYKNTDLHFLRLSIASLYKFEIIKEQEVRDYSLYFLCLAKTLERKKIGLLNYADIMHRIHNTNDSLASLALSLNGGEVAINNYYLTGIVLVRLLRDNKLTKQAQEVIDKLESQIKSFDKNSFELIASEIEFNRLTIKFIQLSGQFDKNQEELKKLLEDTILFCCKEKQNNDDITPSLTLAIQINNFIKNKDKSFVKYDELLKNFSDEKISFKSIISSLLNNDFDSIFLQYKKIDGSYADDLSSDIKNLRVLAESFINDIEGANDYEILFCLELLADQSIGDPNSYRVDAQIKKFNTFIDFKESINHIVDKSDIVYLGLNQVKQLIVAKVSNPDHKEIEIKVEESFNIDNYKNWSKKFPKEYGFFDINENSNLFFYSMESLGINIKLSRETIFILDTELHTLVPNIFLFNGKFIGAEYAVSISPSLSWLSHIIDNKNSYSQMRAWISDNDSKEEYTLKKIAEIYKEEKIPEDYNIFLDTSHIVPKNLNYSKLVMITAHGGTHHIGNNFNSISDEGSIKLHYKDFAKSISNNELVILFVCNAGRFDNHPYQSTTISLSRELLKGGCHTIIASPWPLDAFMTTRWFKAFLDKWIKGNLTVSQAVHQVNKGFFLDGDYNPSKYLALSVFGNPFKKFSEENI